MKSNNQKTIHIKQQLQNKYGFELLHNVICWPQRYHNAINNVKYTEALIFIVEMFVCVTVHALLYLEGFLWFVCVDIYIYT